jgi:TonB family protein
MNCSKVPGRNIALIIFAIATLCAVVAAQTDLQVAETSDGTCKSQPKLELDRPDIFSTLYVPPKPNPDAVTPPRVIYSADPKFPSDAPQGQFAGIAKVAILVDTNGEPQQAHVEKSLGANFDQTTITAINQWRFRAALQYGKPVAVKMCVEINYRK